MGKLIELMQRRVWLAPLIALVLLILGVVIGLSIGWMTVEFKPNASDVAAAADSYYLNPADRNTAIARVKGLSKAEQEQILNKLIADRMANNRTMEADRLRALAQILDVKVAGGASGTPGATPAGTRSPATTPTPTTTSTQGIDPLYLIGAILLILVAAALAGVILFTRILPNLRKSRASREETVAQTGTAEAISDWRSMPGAPPPTTTAGGLGRFVPTYMLGNDNYDTSYSLETPKGEFLGECGMGISETIGEGKPDKVTAFDLWLFDKADVRTVTQIVMSDYAFKDQMLRTKLATKGEAVLAEKGKTLTLETQSLKSQAHIVELVYATNSSFPPNSHFQKLVVEIVPVLKEGVVAAR